MINQMKSLQEEASGGAPLIPCFSENFTDTYPLLSDLSPMSPISYKRSDPMRASPSKSLRVGSLADQSHKQIITNLYNSLNTKTQHK